jgi:hypothetical protein
MTVESAKARFFETAHSDFKAQFETMIDEVRKPRRVVEDDKTEQAR